MKNIRSLIACFSTFTCVCGESNSQDARHPRHLIPYFGHVAGTIIGTVNAGGELQFVWDIHEKSNLQGKAVQQVTALDLSEFPSQTTGIVNSIEKNGDVLEIQFVIAATGTTPTGITYIGAFQIIGSCDFSIPILSGAGELGSGAIEGAADIDISTPGVLVLTFSHDFDGTAKIQAGLVRPGSPCGR